MKKGILSCVFLFLILTSFSQSGHPKLEVELPYYIYNLGKNYPSDSIKQYVLEFSCSRKRKIKNLNIYFSTNNTIEKIESANFNNYSFDSLYIISETKRETSKKKIILFFIIKNEKFVKSPKYDNLFSSSDIEEVFGLLQFTQLKIKNFELLKPIIVFKEETMY